VRERQIGLWLDDPEALVEFLGATGGQWQAGFPKLDPQSRDGRFVARYELRGAEPFVRARITGSDGRVAWTNAFRVAR